MCIRDRWDADEKYRKRSAPVLFPFVGSLKDKKFTVDGTDYPMGQHGFARDMAVSYTHLDVYKRQTRKRATA